MDCIASGGRECCLRRAWNSSYSPHFETNEVEKRLLSIRLGGNHLLLGKRRTRLSYPAARTVFVFFSMTFSRAYCVSETKRWCHQAPCITEMGRTQHTTSQGKKMKYAGVKTIDLFLGYLFYIILLMKDYPKIAFFRK